MSRRAALALARAPTRSALSLPTGALRRALAVAALVFVALSLAYVAARQTSLFAVEQIRVSGAPREVTHDVRKALAPVEGRSLVALDPGDVERLLERVPTVRAAHVDRAFPHTLRIEVQPERPLAVYRDGARAWLVARSGRVLEAVKPSALLRLPRVRAAVGGDPTVGEALAGGHAATALAVLDAVPRRLPGRVLYAQVDAAGVTLVLAESKLEIRLGEPTELEAKLAAAVAVLRALPGDELAAVGYVDVSLPERAVTGPMSQPSSESSDSEAEDPANTAFDTDFR